MFIRVEPVKSRGLDCVRGRDYDPKESPSQDSPRQGLDTTRGGPTPVGVKVQLYFKNLVPRTYPLSFTHRNPVRYYGLPSTRRDMDFSGESNSLGTEKDGGEGSDRGDRT